MEDTHQITITDPGSGQLRTIFLYAGISHEELKLILETSFNSDAQVVGIIDEHGVNYPSSLLARAPAIFDGKSLSLLTENSSNNFIKATKTLPFEASEDVELQTECKAEQAFRILDKNGDGLVHKEEFIEVLSVAFDKFLDYNTRYAFAYSCLSAKDIAIATALECYRSIGSAIDGYYLPFDDFCAWYLSSGVNPLRELMILAVDALANIAPINESTLSHNQRTTTALESPEKQSQDVYHSPSPKGLKRVKSRVDLNLFNTYEDERVREFVRECSIKLKLSGGDVPYLLDLISVSTKGMQWLKRELYTRIFYVYLIQNSVTPAESDLKLVQVLDTLFDILNGNPSSEASGSDNDCDSVTSKDSVEFGAREIQRSSNHTLEFNSSKTVDRIHILDLSSTLCLLANANHMEHLNTLFNAFPTSFSGYVSENILTTHLRSAMRLIYYFSPAIPLITDCSPDDLAFAVSIKFFGLAALDRTKEGMLCFEEFVEMFIYALKLCLDMLQIKDGYFVGYLDNLIKYTSSPIRSNIGTLSSKNYRGSGTPKSGVDGGDRLIFATNSRDMGDTYALLNSSNDSKGSVGSSSMSDGGKNSHNGEYDTDCSDDIPAPNPAALEEAQVTASSIAYSGDAISVYDARDVLGLHNFAPVRVVEHMLSLIDETQELSLQQSAYKSGMIELIGAPYTASTVFERSVVDFILDRVFVAMDEDASGCCDLMDLVCGVLLFCSGDSLLRADIALQVVQAHQAQHGLKLDYPTVVRSLCAIMKAQVCLDPTLELTNYREAVEVYAEREASALYPLRASTPKVASSGSSFKCVFASVLDLCKSS